MSCSSRGTYIVVTAVSFRCFMLWSPFPSHGAFPRQSAVKARFFRNEPRLGSVGNPSHRWLAPREPGCRGSFAVTGISPSRYSFIKAEFDTVPNRPQRRTGQPSRRRRSSRVCKQQRPWTDSQCANRRTSCQSVGNN